MRGIRAFARQWLLKMMGVPNGIASLDSLGYLFWNQLPLGIKGGFSFQADLDASLGVYPTIPVSHAAPIVNGDFWYIQTGGTIKGMTGALKNITKTETSTGGTKTKVTCAFHGFSNSDIVYISGTTDYNGYQTISGVTTHTFVINVAFTSNQTGYLQATKNIVWVAGQWCVWNGLEWQALDPTSLVYQVNNMQGNVTIPYSDPVFGAGAVAGDILYGSAANTFSIRTGNVLTTPKFLKSVGAGAVANAPTWEQISNADISWGLTQYRVPVMGASYLGDSGIYWNTYAYIPINAIALTKTCALSLQNNTSTATGATVQMSPYLQWIGQAKNSTSGLSETHSWIAEVLPSTVAGTTTSIWRLGVSVNGGGYTYPFNLYNNSDITSTYWSLTPNVADSGSAIAYSFDTKNTLSTTAKLFSLKNNTVEKFYVSQSGAGWFADGLTLQAGNMFAIGNYTSRINGLANTSTFGLFLENQSASTDTIIQISPSIKQNGTVWDGTGTPSSKVISFYSEVRGVNHAGLAGSGALEWWSSYNGVSAVKRMSLDDSGNLTLHTGIVSAPTIILNWASKTTDYPLTVSDDGIDVTTSTVDVAITLPTAVGVSGKKYIIKKVSDNGWRVAIGTTSSQTIDGGLIRYLNFLNESVTLVSNGANWLVI